LTGFAVSTVRLAAPDAGLISYGEMVEQGRCITAAVSIPVIGDGDTGYGNALNVKRTVKGYIQAGFAGILLEDQVVPDLVNNTEIGHHGYATQFMWIFALCYGAVELD
jgi:2-methylisocitrate lyase-like PEP mutase family enzyme